ncbi:Pkinase-domain-containing protein [Mycena venus]|uniref:Pkinase-domain-containing protein n=1 Tax=Mycena venus TaxID=2733690 RepID=A0A8H6YL55_9AGAR|nr:Pkinase-domain-containing protein [Mycena venus]
MEYPVGMEDYDPAAQTQEQQQPTPSPPEERNPLLWGYLERYPHPNNLVPLSRYELRKPAAVGSTMEDYLAEQQIIVQREIDMMKTLAHPNVCVLYEHFWNAEGSIDLVLEYMSGGDLHDFISKNKGLSERMTKHLMRQLCEALAFVHSKDVAHRDLKPENLLLTTDRPPVLKIADFGLAKVVSPGSRLVSICGTPMYLPPEFARHRIEGTGYGKELDCFSAGGIKFMWRVFPFFWSGAKPGEHRMEHVTLDRELDWQTLEHQKIGIDKEGYPIYLSSPGRRFIRGLMESDPDQRLTMVQALQHEWFRYDQADSYLPPTMSADTCDELTSSFQEVTFHTPKPAAEDAADHASAHNDAVTPASQEAQTSERLKNKGRALEHQHDVLKPTSPEMLQRVQLVFPTPVEECMPVMTAGPSGANKRKYSARTPPPAGDTDTPLKTPLGRTASASPDPEPLTKRGKSVSPDEMDVSPKKSRRRGGR